MIFILSTYAGVEVAGIDDEIVEDGLSLGHEIGHGNALLVTVTTQVKCSCSKIKTHKS